MSPSCFACLWLRIHTGDRPYKCPHPGCEKAFTQLSNLQVSTLGTSREWGQSPEHLPPPPGTEPRGGLRTGSTVVVGLGPDACGCWGSPGPLAPKPFLMPAVLQSHQRQHNKDKPYKCPNCYRAYTDSASLQIHLSAHAIKHAKAYCCSMCGRAYTSVSGAVGSTRGMGGGTDPQLCHSPFPSALQETYLMKHMSKHTVVEHLVSQHSPQRTESPGIPVRISLI